MTPPAIVPWHIIAIDPGHSTGWARGNTTQGPIDCGMGMTYPAVDHFAVIELPEVRRGGEAKRENIITLALNCGRHVQILKDRPHGVFTVPPRNWKGSIKKEMHQPRIREAVAKYPHGARFLATADATYGGKAHNVIDALGLLLWALERVQMGGLYAFELYRCTL